MNKFRFGFRFLAGLTFLAGLSGTAIAESPTVEKLLLYKPRQVAEVTTPSAAEQAACTVELERGKVLASGKTPTAWVLKDGQGRILRKFHDTTGENKVNRWSYYRDGQEAYREEDTNKNGTADQYRWLGPNGSKWGIDANEDGVIDSWAVISSEEVSQEILASVLTRDFNRLKALMITQEDIITLGLPAEEVERLKDKVAKSGEQFQKTTAALIKLNDKTTWVHLETKMPETIPADVIGSKADLVHYRHATILYQEGEGKDSKHNWLQTGELIQVGKAWRVVSAPVPGNGPAPDGPDGLVDKGQIPIPVGAGEFIEELKKHDAGTPPKTREEIVAYNLKRASILEKIAALITKPEDVSKRDVWVRQIAECYAAAAQQGDKLALERLGAWRLALAKDQSGSPLLAFVTYREMSGEYASKLTMAAPGGAGEMSKLQDAWKEKLSKFVSDFPTADDTPDALMQLGMVNEFVSKETEAKNWYSLLVKNFPKHALTKKASGCLERLSLEGKEFDLAAQTLGAGTSFNVKSLRGKPVVVYYWASWNGAATSDFKKIALALEAHPGKVELVCVNLDNSAGDATKFVAGNTAGGTHLFQPGGLDSPLAMQYGITVLPNMFLVGADGKVISRSVQATTLEEELKKVVKESKDK
ncbi:thioredoxin-like domain-containing protein [Zavarzinella formosa]|uniref:thioredoxin-like domain-containing protein n=1 Tax=Zavarzinella formosa TaxID=360055 RepID=UPI00036878E7|nr:thioredoxin-like domain-containing protein [Zavarzinella formosa]